jgi:pimeloyl-ACP methyl ester carboxylesterase
MRRGLGIAAAAGVALLLAGVVYQQVAGALDARRFEAPGRLVDVDGTSLHIHCMGEGSPTVVMDAGLAGSSLDWALVHPGIARITRACAYDRAGYGWSEPAPDDAPRDSAQLVGELHALLQRAGLEPPFVLMGHSFGGYNARLYAARHPEQVAGLVLVDSSHEDQHDRFRQLCAELGLEEACRQHREGILATLASCRALAPFGVMRLMSVLGAVPIVTPHPRELHPKLEASMRRTPYCAAVAGEYRAFPEESASQLAESAPLGDLPLLVLSRGVARTPEYGLPSELPAERAQGVWGRLQQELAGLSRRSRHVVVEQSGHYVHLEAPEQVVDAVGRLLSESRRRISQR